MKMYITVRVLEDEGVKLFLILRIADHQYKILYTPLHWHVENHLVDVPDLLPPEEAKSTAIRIFQNENTWDSVFVARHIL